VPGAAVDDQFIRALGDIRIEVVHQHPKRAFLMPSFAGNVWSVRRSNNGGGVAHALDRIARDACVGGLVMSQPYELSTTGRSQSFSLNVYQT
jgi:hypothetical protein